MVRHECSSLRVDERFPSFTCSVHLLPLSINYRLHPLRGLMALDKGFD
jgi:hypothetical protein